MTVINATVVSAPAIGRRFYRVFHDRHHKVQFAVLAGAIGYSVMRWDANDEWPEVNKFFAVDAYRGSWADCRNAAAEYARQAARSE